MTHGIAPDIPDDDDPDPEDALTLETIGNAQFLFDARWAGVSPWQLAGVAPDALPGQMPIWQAWIRSVRIAEIEAQNYRATHPQRSR